MIETPKITHTVELLMPDGQRAMNLLFTNQDSAQFAYERLSAAFNSETPICTVETAVNTITVNVSTFLAVSVQEYIVHEMAHAQVRSRTDVIVKRYSELMEALED